MKKNSIEKVIANLESSYLDQFKLDLEKKFLQHLLMKEIWKRREAFLQLKIAEQGLSLDDLNALYDRLTTKKEQRKKALKSPKPVKLKEKAKSKKAAKLLKSKSKRKKRASTDSDAPAIDIFGTSYIHDESERSEAKKASPEVKVKVIRKRQFKTSPEQRDYQRRYYQRKKEQKERAAVGSVTDLYQGDHFAKSEENADMSSTFLAKTKLRKANASLHSSL